MSRRTYGQFCGLARAMEMVGERWGMLVVRDLLLGPKRFTDLQEGLPRIPTSILAARLNELEEAGVVCRRVLPDLDAAIVYELTEYGRELETIVLRLALWGARTLDKPAAGELFTIDAAILSLHTTFRPEHAEGVRAVFQLQYGSGIVLHAVVDDGTLQVREGACADADLVIRPSGPMKPIMAGEVTAREALDRGMVGVTGDPALLELFQTMFRIPAAPQPVEGISEFYGELPGRALEPAR